MLEDDSLGAPVILSVVKKIYSTGIKTLPALSNDNRLSLLRAANQGPLAAESAAAFFRSGDGGRGPSFNTSRPRRRSMVVR